MSDFRTLPIEETIAWIRAWTDHAWPMSLQEAFAIRDSLGWTPSHQEPRYFTTKLSTNGKEDGIISRSNEFGIKGVNFKLSTTPCPEENEQTIQMSITAYSQYATALQQLWGPGQPGKGPYASSQLRWTLPNKVSISIILTAPLIGIDIDSPWRTKISEEYDQAMEDYE
ncbi:hypothetical protein J5X07_08115 [Actinomyces bowdenii]|uniref:DUF6301 family protein n=1 Tax=Actinomyces bowdenii TaxID=131109 RepID=UPI001ABC7158|nr:DUF6301 family protein [Actinomyces bowdenii]MBO3724990.1 hypothetical protein [Actinomyces bowdenii]